MIKVKFILNKNNIKEVNALNGFSLMQVAHQNCIYEIEGVCRGSLSCATCHVIVEKGFYDLLERINPKQEEEENMLDFAFHLTKTSRLSCQIIIDKYLNGLTVTVPKGS